MVHPIMAMAALQGGVASLQSVAAILAPPLLTGALVARGAFGPGDGPGR
jgi:hypothetical protein